MPLSLSRCSPMALMVPAVASNRRRMRDGLTDDMIAAGQEVNALTTSRGTTLTASATPHALPASPTEVVSAANNTIEAEWIRIWIHNMSATATNTDALLNIYIGDAGSETLFIDSLSVGWSPTGYAVGLPRTYWFPVRIPRGTRVSASLRSLIASDVCELVIEFGLANGRHWVGSGVETLGETTASSRGTSITPATTGSGWTSIGTSGRRYRHLSVGVQGNNDTTVVATWFHWYVGTGSAILQDVGAMVTRIDSTEAHEARDTGRWCDIPSGTALQLNVYSGAAPSGLVYATLHGVF
jgi:hypothetical protein